MVSIRLPKGSFIGITLLRKTSTGKFLLQWEACDMVVPIYFAAMNDACVICVCVSALAVFRYWCYNARDTSVTSAGKRLVDRSARHVLSTYDRS